MTEGLTDRWEVIRHPLPPSKPLPHLLPSGQTMYEGWFYCTCHWCPTYSISKFGKFDFLLVFVVALFDFPHLFWVLLYCSIALPVWLLAINAIARISWREFPSLLLSVYSGRPKSWLLISSLLPHHCVWLPLPNFFPVRCVYDTTPVKISSA